MYSLIIVDYNSLETTIAYIRLCKTFLGDQGSSHVVVVQNGESSQEAALLTAAFGTGQPLLLEQLSYAVTRYEKDDQTVLYCHTGENMGYARGNNLGVEIAKSVWQDPYYIISNNDFVFDAPLDLSVIDAIFSAKPEVGLIGPRIVTPAGELQSPRRWQSAGRKLALNYWVSAFGGLMGVQKQKQFWDKYCSDLIADAASGPCGWISGCFMFVRADAFEKAGLFDPHTFLYAEELILAKRLEAVGSSVYFCREIEVIHKHGQTTKSFISLLRIITLEFEANCYFYAHYMGVSKLAMAFIKLNFSIFILLFKAKQKLKA